jgi:tetratricopeptide (TPR) repeat protein
MRKSSAVCTLLIATSFLASAQSSPIRIAGVDEPPELAGEPKKLIPVSDTLRQFEKIMDQWSKNDPAKIKALRPELDAFIRQHPDYSDAYTTRAMGDLCYLKSKDYSPIIADITKAIETHSPERSENSENTLSLSDLYAIRGELQYQMGRYQDAMADLEAAVNRAVDDTDRIFMIEGTNPEPSDACLWSKNQFDSLLRRFPKDYRSYLFRGLYLQFFITSGEQYYQQAMLQFQKANALNPRSPLPYYYIGHLYTQSSIWTKAAWTSHKSRFDATTKAAQQYTKAIEMDPKFLPAYELRAMSYFELKQSRQAIKDYDKILELDPDNGSAYHDRALARMDLHQYGSAIVDFDEAIKRMKHHDDTAWMMLENRADCYSKVGEYHEAIADLTKAIELQLGSQGFLFTLRQFRALYPEYDNVPDAALCRKLNLLFWPQFTYEVIAKQLLEPKDEWAIDTLNELYEKRGDAYLRLNDFRRGLLDFNRIFKGIPIFADVVDRWRQIGSSTTGEDYFLDVKTVELSLTGPARLWTKAVNPDGSYSVQSYEIDCKEKRVNSTSIVLYNSQDQVVHNSEESSGWQRVVPDTRGEQLYNGVCQK